MSSRLYIEFSGQPMVAPDLRIWAQWMLTTNRIVAKTRLPQGRLMVSTVFLGVVDEPDVDPPMLYETCVFAKAESSWADYRARYATRDAALSGHARLIQDITASWELDITTRDTVSFDEWNAAVEALLDEMERYGESEETG